MPMLVVRSSAYKNVETNCNAIHEIAVHSGHLQAGRTSRLVNSSTRAASGTRTITASCTVVSPTLSAMTCATARNARSAICWLQRSMRSTPIAANPAPTATPMGTGRSVGGFDRSKVATYTTATASTAAPMTNGACQTARVILVASRLTSALAWGRPWYGTRWVTGPTG